MEDIAKAMEWEFHLINDGENLKENILKVILLIPHKKSEPLILTIDSNSILRNAFMMKFVEEEPELTFIKHTKIQVAPPEVHINIIKIICLYSENTYRQPGCY